MARVHSTLAALNAEWRSLSEAPHPWPQDPLLGPGSHADLLGRVAHRPDALLVRLLGLHRAGDRRAGRVVLQVVLGLLVRVSARDREHDLDDYVAECWVRIADYPASRPRSVRANLVLDTRKAVRGRPGREVPVPPVAFEATPAPEALDQVSRVVEAAGRLGLLDALSGRCVIARFRDDLASQEVATRLGISATHVRWRTSQALRRLAAHADALAPAMEAAWRIPVAA